MICSFGHIFDLKQLNVKDRERYKMAKNSSVKSSVLRNGVHHPVLVIKLEFCVRVCIQIFWTELITK
jgi:hypothetical protein